MGVKTKRAEDFLLAILLCLGLWGVMRRQFYPVPIQEETVIFVQEDLPEPDTVPVKVRFSEEDVQDIPMETYLCGVVLAEMPAYFEPEALKAQAVASRTFALKASETGGKHGDGSVCTAFACCQAFCPEDTYLENGGAEDALTVVQNAVRQTSGWVMTYQGELIDAAYFSCSGGSTEDAVEVWGWEIPYLRATDSPGEETAPVFSDEVIFTRADLEERLEILLDGNADEWIGEAEYTDGGGVSSIRIGEEIFSGVELRSLLGLRSTSFTAEPVEDALKFRTLGFGHRVGMSQFGADAMAAEGKGYSEILRHYYQGIQLEHRNLTNNGLRSLEESCKI